MHIVLCNIVFNEIGYKMNYLFVTAVNPNVFSANLTYSLGIPPDSVTPCNINGFLLFTFWDYLDKYIHQTLLNNLLCDMRLIFQ